MSGEAESIATIVFSKFVDLGWPLLTGCESLEYSTTIQSFLDWLLLRDDVVL